MLQHLLRGLGPASDKCFCFWRKFFRLSPKYSKLRSMDVFNPDVFNIGSAHWRWDLCVQVATFAVNYIGHPFNQSIRENRPFFYALSSAAIFFTAITSDVFRSLNDWLRLVPLPKPFGHQLLLMAFGMMVSCYLWEHTLRWMFPAKMPISRPRRRPSATNKKIQ